MRNMLTAVACLCRLPNPLVSLEQKGGWLAEIIYRVLLLGRSTGLFSRGRLTLPSSASHIFHLRLC